MTLQNAENVGFWGMFVLLVFQNAIIPIANKIIPAKVKADIRDEQRIAAAMEASNKLLATMIEIQRKDSNDHARIMQELGRHSESLAILLDRRKKERAKSK